jgi:hypothetical protein
MQYRILSLIILLVLSVSGCKKGNEAPDFLRIDYGTSFGFCMGYCKRDISLNIEKIVFTKSGWEDSVVTKECTEVITESDYTRLVRKIDLAAFVALDSVIGCPDCADGGAEWIRIWMSGNVKKVTFEYGNEPREVAKWIDDLRDYLRSFENCN